MDRFSTLQKIVSLGPRPTTGGLAGATVKWRMFVTNFNGFSIAPAPSIARSTNTYSPGPTFEKRFPLARMPTHLQSSYGAGSVLRRGRFPLGDWKRGVRVDGEVELHHLSVAIKPIPIKLNVDRRGVVFDRRIGQLGLGIQRRGFQRGLHGIGAAGKVRRTQGDHERQG